MIRVAKAIMHPERIYREIRGGPGTSTLNAAQQTAAKLQERHKDLGERITALVNKMNEAWQGNAADAARASAQPLREAIGRSGEELKKTQDALAEQSRSFTKAYNDVRAVPAKAPESNILNDITPWKTDLDKAIEKHKADASHNIQVYSTYKTASDSTVRALPVNYGDLNGEGGEIIVDKPKPEPGDGIGGGGGRWGGGADFGGGVRDVQPIDRPITESVGPGGGSGHGQENPTRNPWDSAKIDHGGPQRGGSELQNWGGERDNARGHEQRGQQGGDGFGGRGSGGAAGAGAGAGMLGGIGGMAGGGGSGTTGGRGFGGAGGPGTGQPGPGHAAGGVGSSSRASTGKAHGMSAQARSAATGGAMTGAPGGAAAGQRQEDDEHSAKEYLRGDYSGDLVGELPLTAPPVIGE